MKRLIVKTPGIMFHIGKWSLRSPIDIPINERNLKLFLMQVKMHPSAIYDIIEEQTSTLDHSSTNDNESKHQIDVGTGSNFGQLNPQSPPTQNSRTLRKRKKSKKQIKKDMQDETKKNTKTTKTNNVITIEDTKNKRVKGKVVIRPDTIRVIEKDPSKKTLLDTYMDDE